MVSMGQLIGKLSLYSPVNSIYVAISVRNPKFSFIDFKVIFPTKLRYIKLRINEIKIHEIKIQWN